MKIKLLGTPNVLLEPALARANSYRGPDKIEGVSGAIIKYKDGVATVIPMQSYSVSVAMPNPVPYRGASIGAVDKGAPSISYTQSAGGLGVLVTWVIRDSLGGVASGGTGSRDSSAFTFDNWPLDLGGGYTGYSPRLGRGDTFGERGPADDALWVTISGNAVQDGKGLPYGYAWTNYDSVTAISPSYESLLAADQAADTGGKKTYVMTTDGQVLASEVQNESVVSIPANSAVTLYADSNTGIVTPLVYGFSASITTKSAFTYTTRWSGGGSSVYFFETDTSIIGYNIFSASYGPGAKFKKVLPTFEVPEDCVYGAEDRPTIWDDLNFPVAYSTSLGFPYFSLPYGGKHGDAAAYRATWGADATAFKARRKAWLKKNTTELTAALKNNFKAGATGVTRAELQTGKIPAGWDYAIKTQCRTSLKTYQPILMTATYPATDVIVSDTSANLTRAGTKVTTRTVTFSYTDAAGVFQKKVIDGTLTRKVTGYTLPPDTVAYVFVTEDTYLDWYVDTAEPTGKESRLLHQFTKDRTVYGLGLLWSGVVQQGDSSDSKWGPPSNPLTNATYTPSYPKYANTLVGTAPDFILTYHNTVLPKYHAETPNTTHDGNTAWNNSGVYGVKSVSLRLFGPVAADGTLLGVFPDPSDADGCTSVAYYGKATCSFDWSTGTIKPTSWAPKTDDKGDDAPKVVALPSGHSYFAREATLYFVGAVSTKIAGADQTPDAAGTAAYTAVQNGLPYTSAAKAAAASAIKPAVSGAKPVDSTATPLVASPANIAEALPAAVTAAVAAALATYTSGPPDAVSVKYYILSALGQLYAAPNTITSYNYDGTTMWSDVAEAVKSDVAAMEQEDPLRHLILGL
jgi:hypothetical protein